MDNPTMVAQGRGLGSSGPSIPLSRFIPVLRRVCPGLDSSAQLAPQKPATYRARGRCGKPYAPIVCLGC